MAIKSEELRIGNWVYGSIRPTEPMQIKSIDTTICKVGEYLEGYESIEPIPLTAELLEKCGFCRFPSCLEEMQLEYLNDCWLCFVIAEKRMYVAYDMEALIKIELPHIKYLHDLQNWYYWNHNKTELLITHLK